MQPSFRTDLVCTRIEQQGAIFYKIDDPNTHASFRLYEIEYLIAQKMNGQRDLSEIIAAVKLEHNLDIALTDLQKLLNQLTQMGFVVGFNDAVKPDRSVKKESFAEQILSDVMTLELSQTKLASSIEPNGLGAVGISHVRTPDLASQLELRNALKAAFLFIRQGYLLHARDYLLRAKELYPEEKNLVRLLSQVEVLGDTAKRAELVALIKQCDEAFPAIAKELGPVRQSLGYAWLVHWRNLSQRFNRALHLDAGSRFGRFLLLGLVLLALLGGIGLGVRYIPQDRQLNFEVSAQLLEPMQVPIFYPQTATQVQPLQQAWLSFSGSGTVATDFVLPPVGTKVQQNDIVAMLTLEDGASLALQKARKAMTLAEAERVRAATTVEKLTKHKQALQQQWAQTQAILKTVRSHKKAHHHRVAAIKKQQWLVNRSLKKLAKPFWLANKALKRATLDVEKAQHKLQNIYTVSGQQVLKAPFSGVITANKLIAGQNVDAAAPVMEITNSEGVRLTFYVPESSAIKSGSATAVSVAHAEPRPANVEKSQAVHGGFEVIVSLPDLTGSFVHLLPHDFRLVRDLAVTAFKVPVNILVGDEHHPAMVVVTPHNNVAQLVPVSIVDRQNDGLWVTDTTQQLQAGSQVIVSRKDGESLYGLHHGDKLHIVSKQR